MESVWVEWTLWSRSEPEIIIYTLGDGFVGDGHWSGAIEKVGPEMDFTDLAQLSFLHHFDGFFPMIATPLLLAHLYHAVVFSGGFGHDVAFFNGIGQWLF